MRREARLVRAMVLIVIATVAQPLFTAGCMTLDDDHFAPPAQGTALFSQTACDDDDALDVVFGFDPAIFGNVIGLPHPEPRAAFADVVSAHIPSPSGHSTDHPPRLA